jgi:hypothetical protein
MSAAQTTEYRKVGLSVNKELEKIRKEMIINQLEAGRGKQKGKTAGTWVQALNLRTIKCM